MASVKPLHGQSNYDMSLKLYGSLDSIVKLCKDNDIADINEVEDKEYVYDKNLIVDKNIVGYDYATNELTFS